MSIQLIRTLRTHNVFFSVLQVNNIDLAHTQNNSIPCLFIHGDTVRKQHKRVPSTNTYSRWHSSIASFCLYLENSGITVACHYRETLLSLLPCYSLRTFLVSADLITCQSQPYSKNKFQSNHSMINREISVFSLIDFSNVCEKIIKPLLP